MTTTTQDAENDVIAAVANLAGVEADEDLKAHIARRLAWEAARTPAPKVSDIAFRQQMLLLANAPFKDAASQIRAAKARSEELDTEILEAATKGVDVGSVAYGSTMAASFAVIKEASKAKIAAAGGAIDVAGLVLREGPGIVGDMARREVNTARLIGAVAKQRVDNILDQVLDIARFRVLESYAAVANAARKISAFFSNAQVFPVGNAEITPVVRSARALVAAAVLGAATLTAGAPALGYDGPTVTVTSQRATAPAAPRISSNPDSGEGELDYLLGGGDDAEYVEPAPRARPSTRRVVRSDPPQSISPADRSFSIDATSKGGARYLPRDSAWNPKAEMSFKEYNARRNSPLFDEYLGDRQPSANFIDIGAATMGASLGNISAGQDMMYNMLITGRSCMRAKGVSCRISQGGVTMDFIRGEYVAVLAPVDGVSADPKVVAIESRGQLRVGDENAFSYVQAASRNRAIQDSVRAMGQEAGEAPSPY